MYQHVEDEKFHIGLHDCRINRMEYEQQVLSFDFPEGFYILEQTEPQRCGNARMECHIVDEDIDGICVYIYRKSSKGNIVREDWSDNFIMAINNGSFEFEIVTTFRSYQRILFKGYVWFDVEPYHMECEIELHTDKITYMWNDI